MNRMLRRALFSLALLWATNALAVCTIDPLQVHSNVTLSNGNHTWTSTSTAFSLGRATTGYLAGAGVTNASYKLYFEMTVTNAAPGNAGNAFGVGIDAFGDNVVSYLGQSFQGVGLYNGNNLVTNGATAVHYFTFTSAAVIGVAVDFFNQKVWWTKNGTTWNNDIIANQNPATNTGGFGTFAAPGVFGGNGNAYKTVNPAFGTLDTGNIGIYNGGDSSFSYALPSGFVAWCGAPVNSTLHFFRGGQ